MTELGKVQYHYLNKESQEAKLHKMFVAGFGNQRVDITSVTDSHDKLVLRVSSDRNAGSYYLVDVNKVKAFHLMNEKKWLREEKLNETKPIAFTARDDQIIHGYLTLPKGEKKKHPLVILPHGGPKLRDYWSFDPEIQLLANQGYAVFQVNFRGSTGYGLEFEQAGNGNWGASMQDDLTDATKYLIEKNIVDAERICIFGHSYGGYAALMGVVREPDLYQCAIGSMGGYDLPLMFEKGNIQDRKSGLAYLKRQLGTDQTKLLERSPHANVQSIKANLLLIHGRRDNQVPIKQAESLMEALDKNDKSYEWLELVDEGHGIFNYDNRVKVYSEILDFLEDNIGD